MTQIKNIFIINPKAGQGEAIKLIDEIKRAKENLDVDVEIYLTKSISDAENYCRQILLQNEMDKEYRIFACGGDGTLNEVLNGCVGIENVSIGCIPKGTGNDFVRNFDSQYDFNDIKRQLLGKSIPCDVLKYKGVSNGQNIERYCLNMFNIGFDSNVIYAAARLKKIPFVSGHIAYFLSVLAMVAKMKGAFVEAEFDDGEKINGEILLLQVANGKYCGGGIKSTPKADVFDGLMDVCVINRLSRIMFFKFLPAFIKGEHLHLKGVENLISYKHCKSFRVKSKDHQTRMGTDGEISNIEEMNYSVIPKGINLIMPN